MNHEEITLADPPEPTMTGTWEAWVGDSYFRADTAEELLSLIREFGYLARLQGHGGGVTKVYCGLEKAGISPGS